jgi:hypothetical protein
MFVQAPRREGIEYYLKLREGEEENLNVSAMLEYNPLRVDRDE